MQKTKQKTFRTIAKLTGTVPWELIISNSKRVENAEFIQISEMTITNTC